MRLLKLMVAASLMTTASAPALAAPTASAPIVARRVHKLANPPECLPAAPVRLFSRIGSPITPASTPTIARTVLRNANPAGCLSVSPVASAARAGALVAGGNSFVGLPLLAALLAAASVAAGGIAIASSNGNKNPSSP